MLKEYDFWQTQRISFNGLNFFGTNGTDEEVFLNYEGFNVGLKGDAERIAEKYIKAVEENFALTGGIWEKVGAPLFTDFL